MPTSSRKEALRCLRWYTMRWRIEEWHRVLKSDVTWNPISIALQIGWRALYALMRLSPGGRCCWHWLGREVPEIPFELLFSSWECTLLERLQPMVAPETMTGKKNCA